MRFYTIGEAEALTGIRAYELRQWENLVPALSARKDLGGRRSYSARDIQIIMRLSYLMRETGCTIERAWEELIAETAVYAESAPAADALAALQSLREDLFDLCLIMQKRGRQLERLAHIRQGRPGLLSRTIGLLLDSYSEDITEEGEMELIWDRHISFDACDEGVSQPADFSESGLLVPAELIANAPEVAPSADLAAPPAPDADTPALPAPAEVFPDAEVPPEGELADPTLAPTVAAVPAESEAAEAPYVPEAGEVPADAGGTAEAGTPMEEVESFEEAQGRYEV